MDRKFISAMAALLVAAGGIGKWAPSPWNAILSLVIVAAVLVLSIVQARAPRGEPGMSRSRTRRRWWSGQIRWRDRSLKVEWRSVREDEYVRFSETADDRVVGEQPALGSADVDTAGNGRKTGDEEEASP